MGSESIELIDKFSKKYHAVVVPFPAQGHVIPFMQLSKKLVRLGFHITFVNTTHIHQRLMKSKAVRAIPESDINFVDVSDGLPDDFPRLADFPSFFQAIREMGPAFEDLFSRLLLESPKITCVISDILMSTAYKQARKLGIGPVAAFATPSAISFHCTYFTSTLIDAGVLPLPPPADPSFPTVHPQNLCLRPPQSDAEISAKNAYLPANLLPGTSPEMRVKHLPTNILQHEVVDNPFIRYYVEDQNPFIPLHDCLLVNTFYELDSEAIDAMVAGHVNSYIYAIGPLVFDKSSSFSTEEDDDNEEPSVVAVEGSLWEEDPEALVWLNSQEPKSVIYVSFGSIAQSSVSQVLELAYGLEQSQQPFLWVIRPDLVKDLPSNIEFLKFSQRVKSRALLVPWVPQTAVLSHPSVGAFLTHCGWNSVVESIATGVPILGWPFLSDQITNSFYVSHVWKIGLEVGFSEGKEFGDNKVRFVTKEEVGKKVKKIMVKDGKDPEMDSIRQRSKELQILGRNAVKKGGSSHKNLVDFVKQMTSSRDSTLVGVSMSNGKINER